MPNQFKVFRVNSLQPRQPGARSYRVTTHLVAAESAQRARLVVAEELNMAHDAKHQVSDAGEISLAVEHVIYSEGYSITKEAGETFRGRTAADLLLRDQAERSRERWVRQQQELEESQPED